MLPARDRRGGDQRGTQALPPHRDRVAHGLPEATGVPETKGQVSVDRVSEPFEELSESG